ncbi:MAG: type II secretion system F family protein [Acidimicrobiales bacterium]
MIRAAATDARWRVFLAAVLTAMLVVAAGPAVLAQDDEASNVDVGVRQVDMRAQPKALIHTGSSATPTVGVLVNGVEANSVRVTEAASTSYDLDTVLVIDDSEKNGDSLEAIKASAIDYVNQLAPNERVSIVTAGSAGRLLVPFSSNPTRLANEIATIEASGPFRMWDGMSVALDQLERGDNEETVSSMVVFAAGAEELSDTRPTVVEGRLLNLNALVHVVGVDLRGINSAELRGLVADNGGSYNVVSTTDELAATGSELDANARGLYAVSFQSDEVTAGTNLDLTVDGEVFEVGYIDGSAASGETLNRGQSTGGDSTFSFLTGDRALLLGIVLGALAIGMAVLAIGLLFQNDESALSSMLTAYQDGSSESGSDTSALANNAIFQKAVELTESIAEKQGTLARTEEKLEQANLPFKAAEALTFYAASVVVSLILAFLLRGDLVIAGLIVLGGIVAPWFTVKFMAARRRKKFVAQLPDTLTLLAGTLKAGYSFMQGLESVSKESEDPIGEELRKVVTEAQLGRPVEEALDMSAERMNSDDYAWAIMAVKIQREVGGNLSELLMTVAETMTARERLRRDVAALTAEGRISAIVLGFLPVALGAVMFMINPDYVGLLISETIGNIMLGAGVVAAIIGFLWMKKLITIEI